MNDCRCPLAGWCDTFKRIMSPRQRQICAGEVLTPAKRDTMRLLWAEQAGTTGEARPRLDCIHRGGELRRELCATCRGTTWVKIFACQLHAECSIEKHLAGVVCCRTCGDYRSS